MPARVRVVVALAELKLCVLEAGRDLLQQPCALGQLALGRLEPVGERADLGQLGLRARELLLHGGVALRRFLELIVERVDDRASLGQLGFGARKLVLYSRAVL